MVICPKCGCLVDFNTYFGKYSCNNCDWEDSTYKKNRIEVYRKLVTIKQYDAESETELHDKQLACI